MGRRDDGVMRIATAKQRCQTSNVAAGRTDDEMEGDMCYGTSMLNLGLCWHGAQYCRCYEDERVGCGLPAGGIPFSDLDDDKISVEDPRESLLGPQSPLRPATEDVGLDQEEWEPLAS